MWVKGFRRYGADTKLKGRIHDLDITSAAESLVLHSVSLRGTFM